ncbi:MAG: hypothetical protein ACK5XZ_05230 [Hyphomonadaceae bacterium]
MTSRAGSELPVNHSHNLQAATRDGPFAASLAGGQISPVVGDCSGD